MALYFGQSSVLPAQPYYSAMSITKKISHYIFNFDDKIGQGNFSKVYKGFDELTRQQVAIKIIELSSIKSPKLNELLFSEIEVIQSLNHPNILKCYEVLKSQNNCYIITELCNGGDLQSVLKKEVCLNENSILSYSRDIYKGLLYLGQRGIVHRDLKIANIFLHNGSCKIADFGFAKYTNNQNFFDLDIGSPLYMSPEGIIQHMYGMKTDIWAFGVILYELTHGKTPFSYCNTEYELKKAVTTPISYQSLRNDLSVQIKHIILKCLIIDLNHRPDAICLKSDPFISKLLSNFNDGTQYMKKSENLLDNQNIHANQFFFQPSNFTEEFFGQKNPSVTFSHNNNYQYTQPLEFNTNQHSIQSARPHQINSQCSQFQQLRKLEQFNQIQQLQQPTLQIQHSPPLTQQIQLKNWTPLQFNSNSPVSKSLSNGASKQASLKVTIKPGNIQQNENSRNEYSRNHEMSPISQNNYLSRSQNMKKQSNLNVKQITLNPRNKPESILSYEKELKDKNKLSLNYVYSDKISESSWSHNTSNQNIISKTFSSQNIKIFQKAIDKTKLKQNSNQKAISTNGEEVTNLNCSSAKLSKSIHSNSHGNIEANISQPLSKGLITLSNKSSNVNQIATPSSKKFGQIIKGQKKNDSQLKSSVRLDKIDCGDQPEKKVKIDKNSEFYLQKPAMQRPKTKSQLSFDQTLINNKTEPIDNKKRLPNKNSSSQLLFSQNLGKTSIGYNQLKDKASRYQLPAFIQQKQNQKLYAGKNLICTVMNFEEGVGFLHYCRLLNKFIGSLKKVSAFSEVNEKNGLKKIFSSSNQNFQIYARFLLTAINQLIISIKNKEIIYDGQNYKKKKLKQDKLKEVTEDYFKKYINQINKNRSDQQKIVPLFTNYTSISFIKEHNDHFWEILDKEYTKMIQQIQEYSHITECFIKNFTNLCYFALRLSMANQIIVNCINLKNYKILSQAFIENWLAQQYYSDQIYSKLKAQHHRKINQSNRLKTSDANQTATSNNGKTDS